MIRLTIHGLAIEADTPRELETTTAYLFSHISNKEMCDLAGVSERTIRRFKESGAIKRKGRIVTRAAFLSYLSAKNGKKRPPS